MSNNKILNRLSHIDENEIPESWNSISEKRQNDLLDFYNVADSHIDVDDLQQLSDLFNGLTGNIHWLECNDCGENLCIANPDSWNSFQGVYCANESYQLNDCCIRTMSK